MKKILKKIFAPRFKAWMLEVDGRFGTNVLGTRDDALLNDPASFGTKEARCRG